MKLEMSSMQIEQEFTINAPKEKVFAALVKETANWWIWAQVSTFIENERLELRGPTGVNGAVTGLVSFELSQNGQGTNLKLLHTATGLMKAGSENEYRRGWIDLFKNQFTAFTETSKFLAT